ncbi:uncharacterized protein LOC118183660 [Stegodyphus dumicola]|uniref:uncharacterized protein LOC118183660 n=1 Tax=Stegodyphus dumicola TaxID=202533 RepID=UPI0015A8F171|nr:uncharacterized protein LOC118183660 [Stegodyphus dumicola]
MNSSRHLSTLLLAVFFIATLCRGENPKYSLLTYLDSMNCSLTHKMKNNDRNGTLSLLGDVNITKCSLEVNSPIDGKNSDAASVGYFRITDISVMIIDGMNETDSSILDVQITVTSTCSARWNTIIFLYLLIPLLFIITFAVLFIRIKDLCK